MPEAGEVSIATIASGQMPLTPVSCLGRIHTIFGTQERYPVCKYPGSLFGVHMGKARAADNHT